MRLLFIHQNFPGQYLHLTRHMHRLGGHEIFGLGETVNIKTRGVIQGITTLGYATPEGAGQGTHHYLQSTEAAVRRGQAVARSLLELKGKGFKPDVISVHPGWGEGLFVRDVFPDTPILMFSEFYFSAQQADVGFDPEFPISIDWDFSMRMRNTAQVISMLTANACLTPTRWQASRYPEILRRSMHIIHDGVDAEYMCPDPVDSLTIQPLGTPGESRVAGTPPPPGGGAPDDGSGASPAGPPLTLTRKDKVITYVARNLEPYRGFHIFMRALPRVQRLHPDAHIIIVGHDGVSYSPALPAGETYKNKYLKEVVNGLDLSRIHFLGRIPYDALRSMFRISSAHVYLTYPFVLSWSALEAMACECLLIASDTHPVREVITDRENGLLTDFFDQDTLVRLLDEALTGPGALTELRRNARRLVVERFALQQCLRRQAGLLEDLAKGKYPNPPQ